MNMYHCDPPNSPDLSPIKIIWGIIKQMPIIFIIKDINNLKKPIKSLQGIEDGKNAHRLSCLELPPMSKRKGEGQKIKLKFFIFINFKLKYYIKFIIIKYYYKYRNIILILYRSIY